MKHPFFILFIFLMITFVSCKKETVQTPATPTQPVVEMEYTDLNNCEVIFQQSGASVDVNKDNTADLFFGVQLVGDPVNAVDKRQYIVLSSITTALAVHRNEQVIPMHEKEIIPLDNFNGNNWYVASGIILMERNEFTNGAILWRGNWVDRGKKFLPFQVLKNNQRYNGWIELTADKNGERLVLHRMAISKKAENEVKAGE